MESRLKYNLDLLTREITEARGQGIEVKPGWLFSRDRYRQLMVELQHSTLDFLNSALTVVTDMQRSALHRAPADAERLIVASLEPAPRAAIVKLRARFGRLPEGALRHMIGRATNGQPLNLLLQEIAPDSAKAVQDSLAYGVATGQNPRLIAQDVQIQSGMSRTRALAIARTETLGAYREATKDRFLGSRVVQSWTWRAALDNRTCPACAAMNGTEHPITEQLASHPNCFPAGTVVSGPTPTAATSRRYHGEVVVIRFASGDEMTVTPNHPILTDRGWVAAGVLDESSNVIRCRRNQGPVEGINPDDDEIPPRIEDVAESLRRSGPVTTARVPASPEYLHGDGLGGEIEIVRTEGFLRDRLDSTFREPCLHNPLCLGLVTDVLLSGFSAATQLVGAGLSAACGILGGTGVPPVFLWGSLGHHAPVGLGTSANLDASLGQYASDRATRDSEGSRDGVLTLAGDVALDDGVLGQRGARGNADLSGANCFPLGPATEHPTLPQDGVQSGFSYPVPTRADLSRFAGEIFTDGVLKVGRRSFSGHVYNLESAEEWYIANNTIVHNCRCSMVPNTPSWAELGFSGIPDSRPPQLSPEERFDALPEADQLAILGHARLDAYNAGQINFADLVTTTQSQRWGTGRKATSLTALGIRI